MTLFVLMVATSLIIWVLPPGVGESFVILFLLAEIGVAVSLMAEVVTTLVARDFKNKFGL